MSRATWRIPLERSLPHFPNNCNEFEFLWCRFRLPSLLPCFCPVFPDRIWSGGVEGIRVECSNSSNHRQLGWKWPKTLRWRGLWRDRCRSFESTFEDFRSWFRPNILRDRREERSSLEEASSRQRWSRYLKTK